MPSSSDMEARLKDLESILGHRVCLLDEPLEQATGPEAIKKSEVVHAQKKEQVLSASPSADCATQGSESASNALEPDDSMVNNRDTLPFADMKPQDLSNEKVSFCPWKVVLSYPECFTGKANRPRVRIFFNDILTYRDWNFFYIRDKRDDQKAHLLVPTNQVHHFLDLINKRICTELAIPKGPGGRSFYLRFAGCGEFRPRYLMHHRRDAPLSSASNFRTAAADSGFNIEDPQTWPTDNAVTEEAWKELNKEAESRYYANMIVLRRDPRDNSKLSAEDRFAQRQQRRKKQMKDMLDYIGLEDGIVAKPSDAVFCCVDVEAIEVPPNPISEIGIALLDMQQTAGKAPGHRGIEWWPLIKAHHLRVKEYSGLTNYRYLHGCPEDFQFGESTIPTKAETAEGFRAILQPYISSSRRVILVGHDVIQDVKYLESMGLDLKRETSCIGTVDSQVLHQAMAASDASRGLGSVLDELEFQYSYLHNAGNDAVHTLRAAIGIAFAATEPKDEAAPE